jgi:hypothetical protein
MDHGCNHSFLGHDAINHPIAVNEEFANIVIVKFGDLAAGKRKLTENSRLVYDSKNNAGVGGKIGGM